VLETSGAAGGTQYDEDAAHVSGNKGTMALGVRRDANTTLVGTDGDYAPVQVDANGNLKVAVIVGATSGTEYIEGDVDATIAGTAVMWEDSADTLRAVSAAKPLPIGDAGGSLTVDGTVAATQSGAWNVTNVSGTVSLPTGAATLAEQQTQTTALQLIDNLVLAEDAVHASADPGVQLLAVRKATPADLSGTDGDYEPLQISAGRVWASATIDAALPAGANAIGKLAANSGVDIGDIDVTSVNAFVAHDAVAAGNPLLVAGISQDMDDTAPPNRVSAEGDATRIATDRGGAIFAHPHGPQIWSYHVNGSSALTDASVHAAPGAGLSLYVTDIVCSSGAATAMNVFLEEGSTVVLGPYYLEATAGRGFAIHFGTPKKITVNTALTVTTSAGIAHAIDVTGFTGQG